MKLIFSNGITIEWEDLEHINADKLTRINPYNIEADAVVTPVYMNKIGQLMAEMKDEVSRCKYELDKIEDDLCTQVSQIKTKVFLGGNGKKVIKSPDRSAVMSEVRKDVNYVSAYERLKKREYQMNSVTELYWAVKKKADFIEIIAQKRQLFPDGLEEDMLEAQVNKLITKITENGKN